MREKVLMLLPRQWSGHEPGWQPVKLLVLIDEVEARVAKFNPLTGEGFSNIENMISDLLCHHNDNWSEKVLWAYKPIVEAAKECRFQAMFFGGNSSEHRAAAERFLKEAKTT